MQGQNCTEDTKTVSPLCQGLPLWERFPPVGGKWQSQKGEQLAAKRPERASRLLFLVSNRHTAGVGVQALPLGKIGNAGGNLAQRLPGVVKKAGFLDEIVHAQGAGEAGGAAGGQGVVGACEVITQRLGHVAAQEDAARILDLVQHAERVFHTDFQMLGCNDVAGLNGLVQVRTDDDLAVVVHAGPGNGGTGQLRDLNLQLGLHGLGKLRAVGDKDGAGQLVVLGLAQQISCHPGGVAAAIGQYQNLAGCTR